MFILERLWDQLPLNHTTNGRKVCSIGIWAGRLHRPTLEHKQVDNVTIFKSLCVTVQEAGTKETQTSLHHLYIFHMLPLSAVDLPSCVWLNTGWRASFSLGFPGSVGTSLACFAICRKCYAKPGRRSSVVAHPKQTFHSRKDHIFYLRRTLTREEAFGNSTRSLGSFVIPVSIMVHATGQPECFTNTLWWFSENFWANRELKWTR